VEADFLSTVIGWKWGVVVTTDLQRTFELTSWLVCKSSELS